MIVEITLRFCSAETTAENRGREIFRACLAVASGNSNDRLPRSPGPAPVVGERPESNESISYLEDRNAKRTELGSA